MNILVIDAQGGGIGKQLVTALKRDYPAVEDTAVGTNSAATAAMLKAGADHAATGENAVIVGARKADIICGAVGIVIADSMYGEITPKMAEAVAQCGGKRILIPFNHCDSIIAGVSGLSVGSLIQSALDEIGR
jgi:prephenate dehydrogenase